MSTTPPRSDASPDASAAPAPAFPEAELPVEPGARSELLAATHVFAVELRASDAKPWVPVEGGLRERRVDLTVALLEDLKDRLPAPEGPLRSRPLPVGSTFPLTVEQRRLRNPMGDHPGLWSHLEVEPGTRYVFASRGTAQSSAAELMREGPVLAVWPGSAAVEVHLARGIEYVFQAERRAHGNRDATDAAARAAIGFVSAHLPVAGDVTGRFLWARIQPTFLHAPAPPVSEAVALLTAPQASRGLRVELIAGLDAVAQAPEVGAAFIRTVAAGYFTLLRDPGASALHPRLVDVSLYLLLFPGDARRFPAETVFPEAAERARLRAALAPFTSEHAQKLASWLGP